SARHDTAGWKSCVGVSAELLSSRIASDCKKRSFRMKTHRLGIVTLLLVFAALLLAAAPGLAQLPSDPAERAKVIAQILQTNAQQLTIFDRSGNAVKTIGSRGLYTQPGLSPDGKRLAVVKADLDKESNDLWVFDVETGQGKQITFSQSRESAV